MDTPATAPAIVRFDTALELARASIENEATPPTVTPAPVSPGSVTGRVLSAPGGENEAPPEVCRLLVLTDEGLFLSPEHADNLRVLEYIAVLRYRGVRFLTHPASIDQITAAYAAHALNAGHASESNTNSDQQRRIISLLVEGLKTDASDVHFIINRHNCDVRFRILGELETKHGYTRHEGMRLVSALYGSMCDVAAQTFNHNAAQDARLSAIYTEALGLYGARVATRPTHDGLLVVLRLLKSDSRVLSHAELGFLPQQVELLEHMASRTFGVAIIAGPTGSGKSRTLQATMAHILQRESNRINLITIEDPPEYPIPGAIVTPLRVTDRGDPQQVSRAWREAISNTMRLDPDVIMVGEIRDLDSANTAFAAAMTGHGVWGTLHANDATSIAERLIDIQVDRAKVTDPTLLVGLMAQRLLPVLCEHCKIALAMGKARLPPATLARLVRVSPPDMLTHVYVRGDGCVHCGGRGIVARRPVIEAIVPSVRFMEEFRRSAETGKILARRYWVEHMHGITMVRHALHLVWHGQVDPLSAEDVAPLDNDLHLLGVDYATASQLV